MSASVATEYWTIFIAIFVGALVVVGGSWALAANWDEVVAFVRGRKSPRQISEEQAAMARQAEAMRKFQASMTPEELAAWWSAGLAVDAMVAEWDRGNCNH